MNFKDIIINALQEVRPDLEISGDEKLIEDGLLDSFDIVTLILEINEAFGLDLGPESITPENFNTVQDIEALVKTMKG